MSKSSIDLARIEADFDQNPKRVFSIGDFTRLLASQKIDWNLPSRMLPESFIDMMIDRTRMQRIKLKAPDYPQVVRYVWGPNVPTILVALSIRPHAFCSHGSAMWIHGLGGHEDQMYVNAEQSPKPTNRNLLLQEAINRAFLRPQRRSKLVYRYEGKSIVVLNGKHTGRLEVERAKSPSGEEVEATSLERTLIDITVRPGYAGGVSAVLDAFRIARGKASVEKLLQILKTFQYSYPYHQSIGFYLKQSNHAQADLDLVRKLGAKWDFYLDYGMKDPAFDKDFRVYFPNELKGVS